MFRPFLNLMFLPLLAISICLASAVTSYAMSPTGMTGSLPFTSDTGSLFEKLNPLTTINSSFNVPSEVRHVSYGSVLDAEALAPTVEPTIAEVTSIAGVASVVEDVQEVTAPSGAINLLLAFFAAFPAWIVALTSVVTAATAITALTPSTSDDKVLAVVLKYLNILAGNFGANKNLDSK